MLLLSVLCLPGEHQFIQRPRKPHLLLSHVDSRRWFGRQPSNGRHLHPVRLGLEPATGLTGHGTRASHRTNQKGDIRMKKCVVL